MTGYKFIACLVIAFVFGAFSHCVYTQKTGEQESVETPITKSLKKSFDSLLSKVKETNIELVGIKDRQNILMDSLVKVKKSTNEEKKQVRNFTPSTKSRWIDSLERANNLK